MRVYVSCPLLIALLVQLLVCLLLAPVDGWVVGVIFWLRRVYVPVRTFGLRVDGFSVTLIRIRTRMIDFVDF